MSTYTTWWCKRQMHDTCRTAGITKCDCDCHPKPQPDKDKDDQ